jgi:hypothetical protein
MDEPRRSIQDLIPPARSKPVRPVASEPALLPPNPREKRGNIGPILGIVIGAIIVLGIAFGIVSTVFHRATATVTVKFVSVPVSGSFEASPTGTNLAFATKSVEETASKTVESTGTEKVTERASGVLVISNAYSTATQRLVTNTRFETKDGRIYRIKVPVTVPGYITKNGVVTPGTIEATVYADEPGDAYNLSVPTDFTLPGLKDSPQFAKITARSTGTISGGFVGERAIVSPAVRTQAVEELSQATGDKVRATLMTGLGPDDVVVPGTVETTITNDPDQPTAGGAIVTVRAVATAPVFSMSALARVLASEGKVDAVGPMDITNLSDLAPSITPSKISGNLTLTLSGTAELKGSYDPEALKNSLVGKNRKDVGAVLSTYPGIEDMTIAVYPFWATSLPDDASKITIKENPNVTP